VGTQGSEHQGTGVEAQLDAGRQVDERDEVVTLLSNPPVGEKALLELAAEWPELDPALAELAESVRLFVLTWDPLDWLPRGRITSMPETLPPTVGMPSWLSTSRSQACSGSQKPAPRPQAGTQRNEPRGSALPLADFGDRRSPPASMGGACSSRTAARTCRSSWLARIVVGVTVPAGQLPDLTA
jgi:hypothetical protein